MKRNRCTALLLALCLSLAVALSGCDSAPAGEESSAAPSSGAAAAQGDSEASSSQSAPSQSETSHGEQTTVTTVEGTVENASKSAFDLRMEDGTVLTVVLNDETELSGEALLEGVAATVTYALGSRSGDTVTGLTVQLSASSSSQPAQETAGEPAATPQPTPEAASSRVEELLSSMTLEEKVGQLFFVRVPDVDAAADVAQYQFGGYILFGRDFNGLTADQVRQNIQSYQNNASIPLLIGVDEEGGTVVRASSNPYICDEPYWSPRDLYNAGGLSLLTSVEQDKIGVLQGLGINVNFAPVCDITQDPAAFMYDRSLGLDAADASGVIGEVVSLYGENGMGCVLKHFPGYGDNADTHTGIAIDERPYETFQSEDFLPFQAGIEAGAGCVLVSHNIVTCQDGSVPASLSPAWHQVLREELGFTGCVITDDLIMDAVQEYCDASSAAVQAVLAGNDLLCCSDYQTQFPAVLEAVENGTITEERVDESVRRVLRWKEDLGLL